MNGSLTKIFFAACLCVAASCDSMLTARAQAARQSETNLALTNSSIIKLVRAGFKEKTVIVIIRTRPAQFDLAPDQLVELKKSGVGENIILAMLAREDASLVSDNIAWNDDVFGDDENALPSSKQNRKDADGATDIFGSGNGSSARTRSRGGRGSSTDDAQTTGSATVRILRPSTETGGASSNDLKLEKTPTLDDEAIIGLVEAGFSEGTIIRRIENSPAAYDLSPAKLALLRRKRVSQSIINAMSAAMSDDATTRNAAPARETPER